MVITIEKKDSPAIIKKKLKQANEEMKALAKNDILSLCGVLKGKLNGDPVDIIRKMRDEEWS